MQTVEALIAINAKLFEPITEKMCTEMCGHFEAMFEYAQPRHFWKKYIEMAKRTAPPTATPSTAKKSAASTSKTVEKSQTRTEEDVPAVDDEADEQNDSGQFTIESDAACSSRQTVSSPKGTPSANQTPRAASGRNESHAEALRCKSPMGRKTPFDRTSSAGRKTSLGRRTPFEQSPATPVTPASRQMRRTGSSRRRIIDSDSDDDSVISSKSTVSNVSRVTGYSVGSNNLPSTSKKSRAEFERKKR